MNKICIDNYTELPNVILLLLGLKNFSQSVRIIGNHKMQQHLIPYLTQIGFSEEIQGNKKATPLIVLMTDHYVSENIEVNADEHTLIIKSLSANSSPNEENRFCLFVKMNQKNYPVEELFTVSHAELALSLLNCQLSNYDTVKISSF